MLKKQFFLNKFCNFSFPVITCIYINTEYWPEHSFHAKIKIIQVLTFHRTRETSISALLTHTPHNKNFFKNLTPSLFRLDDVLPSYKKSENSKNEKNSGQTNKQTDVGYFTKKVVKSPWLLRERKLILICSVDQQAFPVRLTNQLLRTVPSHYSKNKT